MNQTREPLDGHSRPVFHQHVLSQHGRQHLPLLITALALTVYYLPALFSDGLLIGIDGLLQFYPAEQALAESLRQGSLSFWTPNLQAGFPLLAEGQPGALYPLNTLAFGLLPTSFAHNLLTVLHGFLGSFFVYWWALTMRRSGLAAAMMALAFALSTPLAGPYMPMLETLAWAPLLYVLTEYAVQRKTFAWVWLMTPIVALQWLAGSPQMAFYSQISCGVYMLGRLWYEEPNRLHMARFALGWTAAVGLGMGLAAIQLLPTYELTQFSIRSGGITGSIAGEGSLFPAALFSFILPAWKQFFSNAGLGAGAYIGALSLALAMAALLNPSDRRWKVPLLLVCVVTIVFAFGRFSPLFPLLSHLPGFSSFRIHSRFLTLTQLGLVGLMGFGWDEYLRSGSRSRRNLYWILILFSMVFIANAMANPLLTWLTSSLQRFADAYVERTILSDPFHVQTAEYYQAKVDYLISQLLQATWWLNPKVYIPFLGLAVSLILMRIGARRSSAWTRTWIPVAWVILIMADLFANRGVAQFYPREWVTEAPMAATVMNADSSGELCRFFTVVDKKLTTGSGSDMRTTLSTNYNMLFDHSSTGIYSPLAFKHYYELLRELSSVNLAYGMRATDPTSLVEQRPLLNLLNVCHVLSRYALNGYALVEEAGDVFVYRNEEASPRAYFVDNAIVAISAEEAIALTKQRTDLRTTAIVESTAPLDLTPNAAAASRLEITDYENTHINIDVDAAGDMLLILSDTHYPGWHASVDGQPVTILRAYGLFRAVLVPEGAQRVSFTYSPQAFSRGAGVSILLAVVWLAAGSADRAQTSSADLTLMRCTLRKLQAPQGALAHCRFFRPLNAALPGQTAATPNSSSMSSSRL